MYVFYFVRYHKRHNRGCLRGGPAVARLGRSWAGVLGASGKDSVVPSPSSLTAFVITWMSSSSTLSLALHEADDGKRAGSVTDHVARSRGGTLIMLVEEDRRMLSMQWWRGMRALSRRELACPRLLKYSAPLLFPHRSACRGNLHVLQWRRGICNNAVKFSLLMRLFGSTPDGCRGWPSLQIGRCEVLIRLLEAFQRRISASAKKWVHHWREEIWDVVAGSE